MKWQKSWLNKAAIVLVVGILLLASASNEVKGCRLEPLPTEEPTEAPTEEPTDEPTPEPTDEPTPEPTDEPGGGGFGVTPPPDGGVIMAPMFLPETGGAISQPETSAGMVLMVLLISVPVLVIFLRLWLQAWDYPAEDCRHSCPNMGACEGCDCEYP